MAEETNFSQGEAEEVKYQERKRLLFFGLPWTFTKYTISQDMITVDVGTIICYTGDVTDKELRLSHIKHAKEIKNYLLKASEAARIKRRTLNMQDIGAGIADDVDL